MPKNENLFKPKTEAEKKQEKRETTERQKEITKLHELGSNLINDARYKELYEHYQELRESAIREIVYYENPKVEDFAFNIVRMQEALKSIEKFLGLAGDFKDAE